ncbi:hypothetical protein [Pseudomonas sp. EL_65y_Pfl2_R95]|uniref:hypothetical protein n=1 Tax=Pseudomonas sp. EL_65y_Pfl2_R95 TaxID=3088698 RepID=UPI0030D867CD
MEPRNPSGSLSSSLLALSLVMLSSVCPTPVLAQDGIIVLGRQVQPRLATHPTDIPDPNPTVVNTNISRQVVGAVNGSLSGAHMGGELADSDFANITTGSGINSMVMPNGSLPGFNALGTDQANHQGATNTGSAGHAGGNAGSGLGSTINSTVQRGLAPLNMLTGGQ